ncbi:hypothetical protein LXM50_13815 [Microbacterium sp. Au-Mic1]|uniref:hypothetical protein n=1 Tax=Microbacterium sp. Au-Mic1 TaxID=2906457 RepID=UPI001E5E5118|nr:hypothetical protein [Microbacterium sp. Au-Mic1]MCE4027051.1 hypothetical protein [Microbacterium sp. Au-Mic1]
MTASGRGDRARTLRGIRLCLGILIVGLVVSGVTAFPLREELRLAAGVLDGSVLSALLPDATAWVNRVADALADTGTRYPFIAYGTDWLAFAHLVIAVVFVGPLIDPVRNIWVIQFGVIACAGIVPLALIAGSVRGIPLGWQLIDMSFGVLGVIPVAIAWRLTRRLERMDAARSTDPPDDVENRDPVPSPL